jgi:hypothetical protein
LPGLALKPIWNYHNESSLYNKHTLIKKLMKSKERWIKPDAVVHICNSIYLGGGDPEAHSSRPAQAKNL